MLMTARMANPALALPGALPALQDVGKAISRARISLNLELLHLRASQINGCSVCVDMHVKALRTSGESDERLAAVAAWRDAPYFSDAERAALALTEVLTRLADRSEEPVSDAVWAAVAEHYDEEALAAIVLTIGSINLWNRLNVATRQVAGGDW